LRTGRDRLFRRVARAAPKTTTRLDGQDPVESGRHAQPKSLERAETALQRFASPRTGVIPEEDPGLGISRETVAISARCRSSEVKAMPAILFKKKTARQSHGGLGPDGVGCRPKKNMEVRRKRIVVWPNISLTT